MPGVTAWRRRGRPPHPDVLTPAEWRVVDSVRHGMSDRTIARRRGVSLDAVRYHVGNAKTKLQLASRAALRHWRGVPRGSAAARREEDPVTLTLGPIGQIARRAEDIARAERWYRDVLGLRHLFTAGTLAFFDCGGTRLMLAVDDGRERVEVRNDSVLYFKVADILAVHDELRRRGVEFVGAPHRIHTHADGTEEWMAFFRDSEGGLLALMSQVRPGVPGATASA